MSEVEELEALHRAAQARLGFAVAFNAADHWEGVQATSPLRTGSKWADAVASTVVEAQALSADLAASYYQLARALELGISMGEPLNGMPATLGAYRDAFLSNILLVAALGDGTKDDPLSELISSSEGLDSLDIMPNVQRFIGSMDESTDSVPVKVDPYSWPTFRDDEEFVADRLYSQAVTPLNAKVKQMRSEDGKLDSDAVQDEHTKKGSTGAGHADMLTLAGGRSVLEQAQSKDRRVVKYARGTAMNPCAFCAMLAARGFVYASKDSAMSTYKSGGLASYHPNCHCFPIARWSDESALPALNQEFEQLWNKEISGKYSGRAAIKAWRRIIDARRGDLTGASIQTD